MASDFAKKLIRDHESVKLQLYDDADGKIITSGKLVKGHPTIGIGRNLEKGISVEECVFMFENDLVEAEITLGNIFGLEIFKENEKRVAALLDMAFNLGESRLRKFNRLIDAVKEREWGKAAEEAKNSLWYVQVGNRGKLITNLLKTG